MTWCNSIKILQCTDRIDEVIIIPITTCTTLHVYRVCNNARREEVEEEEARRHRRHQTGRRSWEKRHPPPRPNAAVVLAVTAAHVHHNYEYTDPASASGKKKNRRNMDAAAFLRTIVGAECKMGPQKLKRVPTHHIERFFLKTANIFLLKFTGTVAQRRYGVTYTGDPRARRDGKGAGAAGE